MEITNVKIFKAKKRGPILAYANVILEDKIIIRGITILETEQRGKFISMPARRLTRYDEDSKVYRDICHPINTDIKNIIKDAVLNAYEEFIKTNE